MKTTEPPETVMTNDTATIDRAALHALEEQTGPIDRGALRRAWGKLNGGRFIVDPDARTLYLLRVLAGESGGHPLEYTEGQVDGICDDQLAMQAVEVAERAAALAVEMGAPGVAAAIRCRFLGPETTRVARAARYAKLRADLLARFGEVPPPGVSVSSDLTPAGLAVVKQRAREAGEAGLDALALAGLLELAWEERDAARAVAPTNDTGIAR